MARGLYVIDQLGPIELADRPAFNTFTTFADVYGAPQKILPRSICDAGLTLDLEAWVSWSTTGTPTISAGFYINGGASGSATTTLVAPTTILCQTQLANAPVATAVAGSAHLHAMATLRSVTGGAAGIASGSFDVEGYCDFTNTTTPFSTVVSWVMPTTDALRTVTVDLTADRAIGVGWAFGTSNAANIAKVKRFYVKRMS